MGWEPLDFQQEGDGFLVVCSHSSQLTDFLWLLLDF